MGVHSYQRLAFDRGEKMFKDKKPCPPKPQDENDCTSREANEWIGYRVALSMDHMERCKVARKLNMPEPEFKELY